MKYDIFDTRWGPMTRMNWACFKCRLTCKGRHHDQRLCPTCRIPMACLGFNYRVPLKRNNRAWTKLERRYNDLQPLVPRANIRPRKGQRTHP